MRTKADIAKRISVYKRLWKECRKMDYKPAQYWYQAKLEALLWVLGEDYSRLKFAEWDKK